MASWRDFLSEEKFLVSAVTEKKTFFTYRKKSSGKVEEVLKILANQEQLGLGLRHQDLHIKSKLTSYFHFDSKEFEYFFRLDGSKSSKSGDIRIEWQITSLEIKTFWFETFADIVNSNEI